MNIRSDKENICLKCKSAIIYDVRFRPTGCIEDFTLVTCINGSMGKNMGYRKTCKRFEEKEDEG